MGLFGKKKEGGFMDVIRCDEPEYLVWKWRPSGHANSTKKENAIRYGSSLRVKDGELAVFFYKKDDGTIQEFIEGPYDQTIKSANFPILTSIVGAAFGGSSPFQAEIYYINLSGNIQIKFGIPYFDLYDPRFTDLAVPCSVRGTLTFTLKDYKNFIKLNRLINFELADFKSQVRDFFQRKTKSVITNIPQNENIPVMQIERKIDEISDIIHSKLVTDFEDHFGLQLKRVDIGSITLDHEHPNYDQLKRTTADQQSKFIRATTDVEIENLAETARIKRKDSELGVEGKNFAVHQLNQQVDVLKATAENLGEMGHIGLGRGGLNAAGLMVGMRVGGVLGSQIGDMMQGMGSTPPPPPSTMYHIAINGQQSGPFTIQQLKQMIHSGQFTVNHYIWKEGQPNWELANTIPEISNLFGAMPPPPPPAI